MGGSRSKKKGYRNEILMRDLLRGLGIRAERQPVSGAIPEYPGDIKIEGDFIGEVKCRNNGGGFLMIYRWLAFKDFAFLKQDKKDPIVCMKWPEFAKLITAYIERERNGRNVREGLEGVEKGWVAGPAAPVGPGKDDAG